MPNRPGGGKKGKKTGVVDEAFSRRIDDLITQAGKLYRALAAQEQRVWQVPSDFEGDLLKVKDLHKPSFDRAAVNANYEKIMQSVEQAGTTGDVISVKMQIDYNAGEERMFRHRHATICRCICHAHGRRYGQHHGDVIRKARTEATDTLAAGAVGGGD